MVVARKLGPGERGGNHHFLNTSFVSGSTQGRMSPMVKQLLHLHEAWCSSLQNRVDIPQSPELEQGFHGLSPVGEFQLNAQAKAFSSLGPVLLSGVPPGQKDPSKNPVRGGAKHRRLGWWYVQGPVAGSLIAGLFSPKSLSSFCFY